MWLGEDGWVVDRFLADNAPLLVGEVERARPVTDLAIPDFCVTEVSEDPRFGNEYLAHHPFPTWAKTSRRSTASWAPASEPGTQPLRRRARLSRLRGLRDVDEEPHQCVEVGGVRRRRRRPEPDD